MATIKTIFLLIALTVGTHGLFAAKTAQEKFLETLYVIPVNYTDTQNKLAALPGITDKDISVSQQSWMCLPSGFDTSSVIFSVLSEALRDQVSPIANAASFLALKLQGYGDNPIKTAAIITALEAGIKNETDAVKKNVLNRALIFVKLIRDINTNITTHIDADKTTAVNKAVDKAVKDIIALAGKDNIIANFNVNSVPELKARIQTKITG